MDKSIAPGQMKASWTSRWRDLRSTSRQKSDRERLFILRHCDALSIAIHLLIFNSKSAIFLFSPRAPAAATFLRALAQASPRSLDTSFHTILHSDSTSSLED
jgi:hypothetical protein